MRETPNGSASRATFWEPRHRDRTFPHLPNVPRTRGLLRVIAFFPQGVNEKNIYWLFPNISDEPNMFNKFCILSLTYRSNRFITSYCCSNQLGIWWKTNDSFTHILKLWRERGDDHQIAKVLGYLSDANELLGLHKEGMQQAEEASEIFERLGDIESLGDGRNDRSKESYVFAEREVIRHMLPFRRHHHLLAPVRSPKSLPSFLFCFSPLLHSLHQPSSTLVPPTSSLLRSLHSVPLRNTLPPFYATQRNTPHDTPTPPPRNARAHCEHDVRYPAGTHSNHSWATGMGVGSDGVTEVRVDKDHPDQGPRRIDSHTRGF